MVFQKVQMMAMMNPMMPKTIMYRIANTFAPVMLGPQQQYLGIVSEFIVVVLRFLLELK